VTFWFKKDWIDWTDQKTAERATETMAERTAESSRKGKGKGKGKGRGPPGINVSMRYVQDAEGVVIDGYRASDIRGYARLIWDKFSSSGRAPKTWSKASLDVASDYQDQMCRHFPELALCDSNWKADKIATDNYPNWTPPAQNNLVISDSVEQVSKRARTESNPPSNPPSNYAVMPVVTTTSVGNIAASDRELRQFFSTPLQIDPIVPLNVPTLDLLSIPTLQIPGFTIFETGANNSVD
jgi:hypothetical protein